MRGKKKTYVLLTAVCLLLCCAIGGTLAWLTADTEKVTNTFTTSNIDIALGETTENYKMVPGWTIEKDPTVTVKAGSEDCWLFVEVTESTDPKLADYIAYSVDTGEDRWIQGEGTGEGKNGIPENVYYRKVTGITEDQTFCVLGAGSNDFDGITYSWGKDHVLVLPTVTNEQMNALNGEGALKPTLTFKAYGVQLWKTNNTENTEFTVSEAWAQAKALITTTP